MVIPAWYLVVYTFVLVFGVCLYCSCRLREDDMIPSEQDVDPDDGEGEGLQSSPEERQEIVELGLVTKTLTSLPTSKKGVCENVMEHESSHVKIAVQDENKQESNIPVQQQSTNSNHTQEKDDWIHSEEESPQQCEICLVDYKVGDVVSWSPNKECTHVFHRECITEWLLKTPHMSCPCCRRKYIIVSNTASESGSESGDSNDVEENSSTESITADEIIASVRVR